MTCCKNTWWEEKISTVDANTHLFWTDIYHKKRSLWGQGQTPIQQCQALVTITPEYCAHCVN